MKVKIERDDYTVTYNDTPELRDAVFMKVLEYYKEHGAFDGEVICQGDNCIIDAPGHFADIADNLIKFKVNWKE